MSQENWDRYFLKLCKDVASNSKCYSRQIGAILVKDNIVISTGYNGPARKIPECKERFFKDQNFINECDKRNLTIDKIFMENVRICPRQFLGYKSGEGLEWCNAIHAEKNCLLSAARLGIKTKGSSLYINSKISCCTQCLSACIQCGIEEIVVIKNDIYDVSVQWVIDNSSIKIREFGVHV